MKKYIILLFVLGTFPAFGQSISEGFTFYMPPFDSVRSPFLPTFLEGSSTSFITSDSIGHFITDRQPIRFWGVNLTTGANFPTKDEAPKVAARMRKMGINLVRLHHMDNPWSSNEGSIFENSSKNTTEFNPVSIDRLHYFLAQLKKNGIYADVNLHVSRVFKKEDGIDYADSLPGTKCFTMFDPLIIEKEKDYARSLLTSLNPYTGLPLVNDPEVAMIEITNENSIYAYWRNNQLISETEGGFIIHRHVHLLDQLWKAFLLSKYSTLETIKNAWKASTSSSSKELATNGDFEYSDPLEAWFMEQHQGAMVTVSADSKIRQSGSFSAKIQINKPSNEYWHLQFAQYGRSVSKDTSYTLSFYARSDQGTTISVAVMQNASPFQWYDGRYIKLTDVWTKYSITFKPFENNPNDAKITFGMGKAQGTIWLDHITLKKTSKKGLEKTEHLEPFNIRRIAYYERNGYSDQRVRDMGAFYLQLQKKYYDDMYHFLKDSLGVQVPITGSNALNGLFETWSMSTLDYIDDHAYWDHIRFPNQPWSPTDWTINNTSMLGSEQLGTIPYIFGGLAMKNKPYTISEYNHCYPNIFQTEMIPILTGYSSFNGADGIMFFEYNGGDPPIWDEDATKGWFELHRNSAVMALFPSFSYAFRKGYIKEESDPRIIRYAKDFIYDLPLTDAASSWQTHFPYNAKAALEYSIKTGGFGYDSTTMPTMPIQEKQHKSSTNQLYFDQETKSFEITTPKFEAFTGALYNEINGNSLSIKHATKFGTISLLSLDDRPLSQSKIALLTMVTRTENTGMQWDGVNTIHNHWGDAPALLDAMKARYELRSDADTISIYPLDGTGLPFDSFYIYPDKKDGEIYSFSIDQNIYNTPWFGMKLYHHTLSNTTTGNQNNIVIEPNPVKGFLRIKHNGLDLLSSTNSIVVLNSTGHKVSGWKIVKSNEKETVVDAQHLSPGVFYLRLLLNNNTQKAIRFVHL